MNAAVESPLTIVMYHYVRELENSRYPAIKGLSLDSFVEQLDYLQRRYVVVRPEDVIAAAKDGGYGLPRNAALLTFDDGYIDHYTNVFPILFDRGLSAMFFPSVAPARDGRVLGVNKIHFILASVDDPVAPMAAIFEALDEFRDTHDLFSNDEYFAAHGEPNRWDPAEIAFTKRMLQQVLPDPLREKILDRLFRRFVTVDEPTLARELYMSGEQLKVMVATGMYVGSHSTTHPWLNAIDRAAQADEIDQSLTFLAEIGAPVRDWVMCYPSGSYDDSLLDILRDRACAVGLTTEPTIADLARHDPLLLPRLDTNHLPVEAGAHANEWTRMVAT